jgi:hypothetical protein
MKQLTVIFLLLVLLLMTACNKSNSIQPINNSVNNTVTNTGIVNIEAVSNTSGYIKIGMSYNSYDLTNNIFFETNNNPYKSAFTIAGWFFTNLTAGQTYYYKCIKTGSPDIVKTGLIVIIKDSTQRVSLNMN